MENTILEVKNLSYSYSNRTDLTLKNINFSVKKGDKIAFIGPNGAGKTTLFLHLNGIIKSKKNTIFINKIDINNLNLKEKVSKIGILFSDPETQLIMPTVYDEISFGLVNLEKSSSEIKERMEYIIKKMNLGSFINRVPHHLSTGQKKKIALASILSINPEILVLDEPTANLDPHSRREIINLINSLNSSGTTIITSTHDLSILSEIANKVYIINKEIIASDSPSNILKDNILLYRNNIESPDIYKLFGILEQMGLSISKLPLNLKDALFELLNNININKENIILKSNENIISHINNILSKNK